MKKRIGAFVVATVMTASLAALPANAMSYTVEGAKERNFGPITSVEFEIQPQTARRITARMRHTRLPDLERRNRICLTGLKNSLTCAESTEAIMSLSVPAV